MYAYSALFVGVFATTTDNIQHYFRFREIGVFIKLAVLLSLPFQLLLLVLLNEMAQCAVIELLLLAEHILKALQAVLLLAEHCLQWCRRCCEGPCLKWFLAALSYIVYIGVNERLILSLYNDFYRHLVPIYRDNYFRLFPAASGVIATLVTLNILLYRRLTSIKPYNWELWQATFVVLAVLVLSLAIVHSLGLE